MQPLRFTHVVGASTALWLLCNIPLSSAIILLPPPGPYNVSINSAQLTDHTRLDPFAPSHQNRSIMISLFWPVKSSDKNTASPIPYMPAGTAAVYDSQFSMYGVPNGTFSSLELGDTQSPTQSAQWIGRFPFLIFSPALGTSRLLYSVIAQSIASQGFVVALVDHPYDANVVEFPNGKLVFGANISTEAQIELALKTRVGDVSFTVDRLSKTALIRQLTNNPTASGLDVTRVGMYGHSLGGATAASTILSDRRIIGGSNLDGTFFGPVLSRGFNRPFLIFGHENKTQATDPSWKELWPHLRGWKLELMLRGAEHYTFSDLPFLAEGLGLPVTGVVEELLGSVKGGRSIAIMTEYLVAFFDFVFDGTKQRLLEGPSKQFGEVEFVDSGNRRV